MVGRLLAVQGQDPRGARLAIRARSHGLTAADVDRALTHDRSLLITWLNRGTLHLVCAEDYRWLHALTAPPMFRANARRLADEGVSLAAAERGVGVIERSLSKEGPLTRVQLRDRISAAGVPVEGQALVHLLLLASLRGVTARGPMVGRQHAFVLVRDWLGAPPKPMDRDKALAELARRYLLGHGPASDRDLAKWSGLPLRDARKGLSAIASELLEEPGGLVQLSPRGRGERSAGPPRLLGSFDPLLMGWVSREAVLGPQSGIVTTNGIFRPFALIDGRAAGTWTLSGKRFSLTPFRELSPAESKALDGEAQDVIRFLGEDYAEEPAREEA